MKLQNKTISNQPYVELGTRLLKVRDSLRCPYCKSDLVDDAHSLNCISCEKSYPVQNEKIYFITPPKREDSLDSVKERLRRSLGKAYYSIGIKIISTSYPFNLNKFLKNNIPKDFKSIVNLGSGNYRINQDIINIDCMDYDSVDIVCDIMDLPFKDNSIDCFLSSTLIEHISKPQKLVKEIRRSTTEKGISIHIIPFMYPFHACPHDYQRYTTSGQQELFRDFEIIEQIPISGPISAILSLIVEFLSLLFSFGNAKLQALMYLGLCGLIFPIKFLDFFFVNNKRYNSMAANILTIMKKS